MQVRVKRIPPGNQPEWFWSTLVGLELSLLRELTGMRSVRPHPGRTDQLVLAVPSLEVIAALSVRQPKASEWCRRQLGRDHVFVFDIGSVELI